MKKTVRVARTARTKPSTKTRTVRKRLTRAQLRVQIAEDVIAQVRSRRIVAVHNNYVSVQVSDKQFDVWKKDRVPTDLRELISGKRCDACALGSLFLAAVDRHDKIDMAPDQAINPYRSDQIDYLSSYFSQNQLDLIETAFESNVTVTDGHAGDLPDTKFDTFKIAEGTPPSSNSNLFRSALSNRSLSIGFVSLSPTTSIAWKVMPEHLRAMVKS